MPKTRQQLAAREREASDEDTDNPAAGSRMALGDVSNRGKTRSSKAKGRGGAARTENPSGNAPRRSSRTRTSNETSVFEEEVAEGDDKAPKRRRSLRSCVLAQRVNNSDEGNRSDEAGSESKPKAMAKKAKGKAVPARDRAIKRGREEETEVEQEVKKPKRSSSKGKKAVDKKSSKSARDRKHSTSRDRKSSFVKQEETPEEEAPRKQCSEFLTESDYGLVREPFDGSKFTLGIAPHDEGNKEDVLEAPEYATDIFQRLYHAETTYRPTMYMDDQVEITPAMRAILIDWLVEVHMKFRLVPPTLHLCVNIIDRFCATTTVERRKLQLVGVTALLVACKYEEIYPPEVRDCVYITDRTYTRQEVLDMEQDIVRNLEFKMTVPTAHPFLVRFLFLTKASEVTKSAANYYLERSLQEYEFLKYRPSLVAAAAVCLALNNPDIRADENATGPFPGIPRSLLNYTGFDKKDILKVAALMVEKVGGDDTTTTTNNRRHLVAVKRKYESRKYHHISSEFENPVMDHLLD